MGHKAIVALLGMMLTAAAAPPAIEADLRAKDQALLDAIAPGDRKTWDGALAPDAVYVDENGAIMDRATFLKALDPLPVWASGHIAITDYKVSLDGDTALVIHRDDEREVYHGIPLHAGYLMTETWLWRGGAWKLALIHAYVVAADPPAISLPAATLDAYVGRYRLASDVTYVIARDGDHLVGGAEGKPPKPLLAEAPDLFFTPGQPRSRTLFRRDAGQHVTGFIDRREGEDLVFAHVP
jgi:hypothetical protein